MNVYLVMKEVAHEGDSVLVVYLNKKDADAAADLLNSKCGRNVYYYVDERSAE